MYFRCIIPIGIAMLICASGAGCKKSESTPEAKPPAAAVVAPPVEAVARVHWLGKKRLAADTNAAAFMEIWGLSQSATLGAQTLGKLSLAPWRLLKGDAATNGAPSELMRALLEDLVQEESYLEIRDGTNQSAEVVLAIRLSEERAGLWQTNLATIAESLTGIHPTGATGSRPGWSLKRTGNLNLMELTRAGEWTLVGLAQNQNGLLGELLAHIQKDQVPFAARTTNFWVEADVDLARVSRELSLGGSLPVGLPRVALTMIGDGKNVNSRAQLNFSSPLGLELEPWNMPTNLVHEPLVSFVAVRGAKTWLESLARTAGLNVPSVNQFYGWSQAGYPLQSYFAVPVANASNQMNLLVESLLTQGNAWLFTNGLGSLERSPEANGVVWTRLPMVRSFLQSTTISNGGEFFFGGWLPYQATDQRPPPEILEYLQNQTNLIAYDWEITQPRVESWLLMNQTLRLALFKAQLPASSPSMAWLKFAGMKLGNSVTTYKLTAPAQISISRQSGLGLTAMELHLLVDWLESPEFPKGLHSFLAPTEARSERRPGSLGKP